MQRFVLSFFIVFLSIIWSISYGQKVDWFRDDYAPSIPYGGKNELKALVEQVMVYPEQAIKKQIEGEVFINYIVNRRGKVVSRETHTQANPLLAKEALRIFDRIVWESKHEDSPDEVLLEKVLIKFSISKYKRLVKKRGYDALPYLADMVDPGSSFMYYTINEIDQSPDIRNYKSIGVFVKNNFKYPSIALQRGISGRVTVEFIVEPYGMASNVRIVEAVAGGCNEETVRLVKTIPWKSGIKDNKAIRTLYRYQLNFVHPGGTMH